MNHRTVVPIEARDILKRVAEWQSSLAGWSEGCYAAGLLADQTSALWDALEALESEAKALVERFEWDTTPF